MSKAQTLKYFNKIAYWLNYLSEDERKEVLWNNLKLSVMNDITVAEWLLDEILLLIKLERRKSIK